MCRSHQGKARSHEGLAVIRMLFVTLLAAVMAHASCAYANETVRIEKVTFLGKPEIRTQHGHAASPLGVWGENSSRFKGRLRIGDNEQVKINVSRKPILVAEVSGQRYLLGQSVFNKEVYAWYAENKHKYQFGPEHLDNPPLELAGISLASESSDFHFKVQALKRVWEKDRSKAFSMIASWPSGPGFASGLPEHSETFSNFVRRNDLKQVVAEDETSRKIIYDFYHRLLVAFPADGDSGRTAEIAKVMLWTDGGRARADLPGFIDALDQKRAEKFKTVRRGIEISRILERPLFKTFAQQCTQNGFNVKGFHPKANGWSHYAKNWMDDLKDGYLSCSRDDERLDRYQTEKRLYSQAVKFWISLNVNRFQAPTLTIRLGKRITPGSFDIKAKTGESSSETVTSPPDHTYDAKETRAILDASSLDSLAYDLLLDTLQKAHPR